MDEFIETFFQAMLLIFALGWAGCMLAIPLAAFKFFHVLFERDQTDARHNARD